MEIAAAPVFECPFGIHQLHPDIERADRSPDQVDEGVPAFIRDLIGGQPHRVVGLEIRPGQIGPQVIGPGMAVSGKARPGEDRIQRPVQLDRGIIDDVESDIAPQPVASGGHEAQIVLRTDLQFA